MTTRGHSIYRRRIRFANRMPSRLSSLQLRQRIGGAILILLLVIAAVKLFLIQITYGPELRYEASQQLKSVARESAIRGDILDRHGHKLAFTVEARSLTFQPIRILKQLQHAHQLDPTSPDPQQRLQQIAQGIAERLHNKPDAQTLYKKLTSHQGFVYLAHLIDPAVAADITAHFPEVGSERHDRRQYPGGALAANIIGGMQNLEPHGLFGLEESMDSTLAGIDGAVTYDRGSDGVVIPGSYRNRHPVINGSTLELTIDNDIQFYVQQQVQQAKNISGAKTVTAVVLDAHTAEVLAMAENDTVDPSQPIGPQAEERQLYNLPITTPFEPGSVNKLVTAAAALEYDLTTPDEVIEVPGTIHIADVTIHDAWVHGTVPYTTTGIFGKSSNVGTLMLAQRIGQERWFDMLNKFGIGHRTDIGLPGESAGLVPPIDQWSGSTFANLPIGQGLSMTLLQMVSMYQTVANDGQRIPPRIIKSIIKPDGSVEKFPPPQPVEVISAHTAQVLRDMFRAVVQRDPMGYQQGTGPSAAVEGYQISGKTGTAQQINPACSCYYDNVYWITFAGIVPSDNPRYVIGLMMDNPQRSADGSGGLSAAPLFHTIASWLLQRDNTPLSPDPGPPLTLQVVE